MNRQRPLSSILRLCIAVLMLMWALPILAIPPRARLIEPYSEGIAYAEMDSCAIDLIEGIYYYPDEKMTVALVSNANCEDPKYSHCLLLVESDNAMLAPGTIVGYVEPTAESHKVYMYLYSEQMGEGLYMPVRCTATFSSDYSTVTFTRPSLRLRLRINFSRFLPTLFNGIGISAEINNPKHTLGMKKIYPALDQRNNLKIRYL